MYIRDYGLVRTAVRNSVLIFFSSDDGVWVIVCVPLLFAYCFCLHYLSQMFDVTGVVSAAVLTLSGSEKQNKKR